jgi:hypothetical protein
MKVCAAARAHAIASSAVARDAKLPAADRDRLAERYAARAVELVQQAVKQGFTDVKVLTTHPDLAPLRAREDFKGLVDDLARKTFKDTP